MTLKIAIVIAVAIHIPFVNKTLSTSEPYDQSFTIPPETKEFDLPDGLKFVASESGGDVHLELEEGTWLPLYNDEIPVGGSVIINREILPGVTATGTIEIEAD